MPPPVGSDGIGWTPPHPPTRHFRPYYPAHATGLSRGLEVFRASTTTFGLVH